VGLAADCGDVILAGPPAVHSRSEYKIMIHREPDLYKGTVKEKWAELKEKQPVCRFSAGAAGSVCAPE
jgi:hypothetical protein